MYTPVWIDLHGRKRKTLWLTLIQITVPLGIFCGYVMTALIQRFARWNTAFLVQIIIFVPIFMSIIKFDKNLFLLQNIKRHGSENLRNRS